MGARPRTSRADALACSGDEQMRIWALGLIGDPRDRDRIVAALADPGLRFTALEALSKRLAVRADPATAPLLHAMREDPDDRVRRVGGPGIGPHRSSNRPERSRHVRTS